MMQLEMPGLQIWNKFAYDNRIKIFKYKYISDKGK